MVQSGNLLCKRPGFLHRRHGEKAQNLFAFIFNIADIRLQQGRLFVKYLSLVLTIHPQFVPVMESLGTHGILSHHQAVFVQELLFDLIVGNKVKGFAKGAKTQVLCGCTTAGSAFVI